MYSFNPLFPSVFLAVAEGSQGVGSLGLLGYHLLAVAVFSFVGIVVLTICLLLMEYSLLLMEKLTPFSIVKEIVDEHNVALSVVMGSVVIGISIIIAASILG
jgi:putative membrane protein